MAMDGALERICNKRVSVVVALPAASVPEAFTPTVVPVVKGVRHSMDHVPAEVTVADSAMTSVHTPSLLGSMLTEIVNPAGRSVDPVINGVVSVVFGLKVSAMDGGVRSTVKVWVSVAVLPARSVAVTASPTGPLRPAAGKTPERGETFSVFTDQVPSLATVVR